MSNKSTTTLNKDAKEFVPGTSSIPSTIPMMPSAHLRPAAQEFVPNSYPHPSHVPPMMDYNNNYGYNHYYSYSDFPYAPPMPTYAPQRFYPDQPQQQKKPKPAGVPQSSQQATPLSNNASVVDKNTNETPAEVATVNDKTVKSVDETAATSVPETTQAEDTTPTSLDSNKKQETKPPASPEPESTTVATQPEVKTSVATESSTEGWSRGSELTPEKVPATEGSNNSADEVTSWKRGSTMAEKTLDDMLRRTDGIIRYSKANLFSMNQWGKTFPQELQTIYGGLTSRERPPVTENRAAGHQHGARSPSKKKQYGKPVDDPHPDEKLIFSADNLNREETFRYQPNKVLDESTPEAILMKATLILNQLSLENFEKLSEKFMNIGMETDDLMCKVVDLIVSKAQLEEPFCFMYADLCRKITDKWGPPKDGDTDKSDLGKVFRTRLLNRCQEEFQQDREAAVKAVMDMDLDEADREEKLLVLKKRYTGHMRFVGEIYMKDLIKANKMHYCVEELLQSRDEEKLACLCKLLQTIGKKLEDYDTSKKKKKFQSYFTTISEMSRDKSLSSKIRFAFKDLIEMRENQWTARREEEKAKKLSEFREKDGSIKIQAPPANTASSMKSKPQDFRQDARQDARQSAPAATDEWTSVTKRGKTRGAPAPATSKINTSNSFGSLQGSTVGNKFSALTVATDKKSSKKGSLPSNNSSPHLSSQGSNSSDTGGWSKTSRKGGNMSSDNTPRGSPTKPKGQHNNGYTGAEGEDGKLDTHTVNRAIACMNEYFLNDLLDEAVEVMRELVHPNSMSHVVKGTIHAVLERKDAERKKFNVFLPGLYTHGALSSEQAIAGLEAFLHDYDEIVIDVPRVSQYTSSIMAHLYTNGAIPNLEFIFTVPDENNFSLSMGKYDLLVQTAAAVKDLKDEDSARSFYNASIGDTQNMDSMDKEQLDRALEKYGVNTYLV
mmetsp:Transcript_6649/g.10038  ORF Transcript_6649/g.10038 Transcript_6649/m.10038 type:complete len:950 (-) Transcript_6649:189-3038(-)|eukprot:CAMPEP_0185027100 /NCGR_PEP_ID=MMETSP1103-20130426/11901_1 /TAXON_ID=36769 /ORGANISM="Paraphysomonas bandaiensis, Strain Caron Lab Isolate" /LENGTH=949 /DNA_ID=CAMNT_0027560955 /DNA_START=95 /DNA_END=2944 /DNA_ORIENTATION=+